MHRLSGKINRAAFQLICTVDNVHQFRAACTYQPSEAQDLPFFQREVNILNAVSGKMLHPKHFFAQVYLAARIALRQLSSNHQIHQFLSAGVLDVQCLDVLAVPHNRHPVTDFEQFLQAVRNIDNGYTFGLEFPYNVHQ